MPVLQLQGLGNGLIEPLDLTVEAGQVVCVSGPSGSGKTRLLRAIADMEPHQGSVRLDDTDRSSLPAHLWRSRVMLVPAESQWWADTVSEHWVQPMPQALEALGFEPAAGGWMVSRLSSGEKQRLALIRAVAREPQALLLDEPTANLDEAGTRRVEDWLRAEIRRRGLPVLWVAHDSAQIRRVSDRHLHIRAGRLEVA